MNKNCSKRKIMMMRMMKRLRSMMRLMELFPKDAKRSQVEREVSGR
jgi:hypothetical protein